VELEELLKKAKLKTDAVLQTNHAGLNYVITDQYSYGIIFEIFKEDEPIIMTETIVAKPQPASSRT
jgi:hypothetical protein